MTLPTGSVYAVTCGRRMIFSLHTPMINGGHTRPRSGPFQCDRAPLLATLSASVARDRHEQDHGEMTDRLSCAPPTVVRLTEYTKTEQIEITGDSVDPFGVADAGLT